MLATLAVSAVLLPIATGSPALAQPAGAVDVAAAGGTAASAPTPVTLSTTTPEVVRGRSVSLVGSLLDPATGAGVAGATVALEKYTPGGGWAEVATLTTDAAGGVAATQVPSARAVYRLRHESRTSHAVAVRVRTVTAALDRKAVRVGRDVTVRGELALDARPAGVRLERKVAGRWLRVGRTAVGPDGSYTLTVTPTGPGFWRYRVVHGRFGAADAVDREVARLPAVDAYRLHRYSVDTRGVVRANVRTFRRSVAATYADPRGWLQTHHRFREVRRGAGPGELTVVLSQAEYLPAYSGVCSTTYSCRVGRYVIINQDRWRRGSPYFPGTLEQYRRMVVNHETGHWLGRGHAYCPRVGALAPVMQQQSKGLHGCRINPWPLPREVAAVP